LPMSESKLGHQLSSALSLSGLVNFGKLEDILHSLVGKIDAQQAEITRLQQEVDAKASVRAMQALQRRLDENLEMVERRFSAIEERVSELEELSVNIGVNSRKIKNVESALESRLVSAEFAEFKEQILVTMERELTDIHKEKVGVNVVSSLEDSQHRLFEEVVALQKVLACKVDRVEIPLLDVASEKVKTLLDFRQDFIPRVEKVEQELESTKRALSLKESKEAVVQRMQNIHERLGTKADVTWVKSHIAEPLSHVQDAVSSFRASEEMIEKLLQEQETMMHEISRLSRSLAQRNDDVMNMEHQYQMIMEEMGHKVDVAEFDSRCGSDVKFCQKLVQDTSSKNEREWKVQAAYLADLRQEITQMKKLQTSTDKKVSVALRFVDWFTDVKLKNGMPNI